MLKVISFSAVPHAGRLNTFGTGIIIVAQEDLVIHAADVLHLTVLAADAVGVVVGAEVAAGHHVEDRIIVVPGSGWLYSPST